MPKLCDKCKKNPAVIHIRAMRHDGVKETRSYCIPCAMEMIGDSNPPPGLKDVLDEVMETLKDNDLFKEFVGELREKKKEEPRREPPSHCPYCGSENPGKKAPSDIDRKCGHCLTVYREELAKIYRPQGENARTPSAKSQGLPNICEEYLDDAKRLIGLLRCYHEAKEAKREDAAESFKEEIQCLRQSIVENERQQCTYVKASPEFLLPFVEMAPRHLSRSYSEFMKTGWLPSEPYEGTSIRLSSLIAFQRTFVDIPMKPDATAQDYHQRLREILWKDPLFQGGFWNCEENVLFSKNLRIMADCGHSPACQHRDFHFEVFFAGEPNDNILHLAQIQEFLKRLGQHNTFFVDPQFGYFSSHRNCMGSAIYPMEYLHLPALLETLGFNGIQNAVQAMDGDSLLANEWTLRIDHPEFLPDPTSPTPDENAFFVLEDTRVVGVTLRERCQKLKRVARFLERREVQARELLRKNSISRNRLMDRFARAHALLQKARMLTQSEAVTALSNLWFAQELGCFPHLRKTNIIDALFAAILNDAEQMDIRPFCNPKLALVPPAPPMDYSGPDFSDLDNLSDTLWEDQDLDARPPQDAVSAKKNRNELPMLPDEIPETPEEFIEMLEEMKDFFRERFQNSDFSTHDGLLGGSYRAIRVRNGLNAKPKTSKSR